MTFHRFLDELLAWPEPPVYEPVTCSGAFYDFTMTPHATIRVFKDHRPVADIEIEQGMGKLEIRNHGGLEVINQKMLTQ